MFYQFNNTVLVYTHDFAKYRMTFHDQFLKKTRKLPTLSLLFLMSVDSFAHYLHNFKNVTPGWRRPGEAETASETESKGVG